jgi:hypothetical protein
MMEFKKEVNTTLPGKHPKKTHLTVVVDDGQAWDALALRAAIVAAQAMWRSAGEVPDAGTVRASELVGRRGRPRVNPVERARTDPAYRARLIAELEALDRGGGEE